MTSYKRWGPGEPWGALGSSPPMFSRSGRLEAGRPWLAYENIEHVILTILKNEIGHETVKYRPYGAQNLRNERYRSEYQFFHIKTYPNIIEYIKNNENRSNNYMKNR